MKLRLKSRAGTGIGIFLIIALVLSACSSGSNTDKEPVPSDSGSGSESSTNVKLEYFQIKTETVETVNKIISQFKQQNPGIQIEQNTVPNAFAVWPTRITSNDAPPIFNHYTHNSAFIKAARDGLIEDITGDPILKNVNPEILKIGEIDGKTYIVPLALATWGIYYNADMFKELGIAIPTTYGELIEAAKKFTAAGKAAFISADQDPFFSYQTATPVMGLHVPNAEQYFNDVLNGKAHIKGNDAMKRLAERLYELHVTYSQKNAIGVSSSDGLRDFVNGKGAMFFNGTWSIQAIKDLNPDFNFGLFPLPADNAADTKVTIQIDTGLGFPANSKKLSEAKKFVGYWATPEVNQQYVDETQYLPAINGVENRADKLNSFNELIQAGNIYPVIARLFPQASNAQDFGNAWQAYYMSGDTEVLLDTLESVFFNANNK